MHWAIRDWWQAGTMFTCLQLAEAQPTVRQGVAQYVCRGFHVQYTVKTLTALRSARVRPKHGMTMEKVSDNNTHRLLRRELLRRSTAASPLADRSHGQARDLMPTRESRVARTIHRCHYQAIRIFLFTLSRLGVA